MRNSKNKKIFTYLVVGALIFSLILSCKSNEAPGSDAPPLSQYAGVYASDNKDFGSGSQYFVIKINTDNTVDYGVSDTKSFPTTSSGTFPTYFTIDSDYCLKLTADKPIADAVLTFSSDGNTITYRVDKRIDGVILETHLNAQTFTMTKVS